MTNRLTGKVAIVTGSTRGIGAETARACAAEGARVVVSGRDHERGAAVVESIRAEGGDADFVACDVTSEDEVKNLIRRTIELYRSIDIVVNNATPTTLIPDKDGKVGELSTENWEDIHRRVVTSAFLVSKYAIPMLVLGGQGSVVNLSSDSARRGYPRQAAYSAAKAGLESLTRSIAVEYGPLGVRCNTIVVGLIPREELLPTIARSPELRRELESVHAFLPYGEAADVAAGVVYLVSEEAKFVTGSTLSIDGGISVMGTIPGPEVWKAAFADAT
jgi:NAD(P)-dependent dehydrogenase (short-subunit alcohol dehydrogenase family)